ncbi:hypothetical protein DPEC_G00208800 [Dallia pectoralis]|uniref:Uncharacterized protein n=1 Tax=Dallia pectoralis TaxID=75939 RepID=A0ACC2G5I5_DALPE|nr:hypothetical protein DPEC_G00208800 [Dallia pectoralis]
MENIPNALIAAVVDVKNKGPPGSIEGGRLRDVLTGAVAQRLQSEPVPLPKIRTSVECGESVMGRHGEVIGAWVGQGGRLWRSSGTEQRPRVQLTAHNPRSL